MLKKKGLVCSMVFILLLVLHILSYGATSGKITGETVKLREKPDLTASLIVLLSINDKVEVIGKEGDWYQVTFEDKKGYVHKDYIEVEGEVDSNTTNSQNTTSNNEENTASNEIDNTATTKENTTNENQTEEQTGKLPAQKIISTDTDIYLLPIINASKIGILTTNTQVTLTQEINGWGYINAEQLSGWIRLDKLKEVKKEEPKVEQKEPEKTETKTNKGYINVDTVNVRKEPDTTSEIIANLSKNAEVQILGEKDNWCNIKTGGKEGYIAKKYISDKKLEVTNRSLDGQRTPNEAVIKTSFVGVSTANVRESSNTSSKIITKLTKGTEVSVLGEEGSFYRIKVEDQIGYISKALVVDDKSTISTQNSNATANDHTAAGSEIVDYAKQFLGVRYVLGGKSPSGFDCSGFTSYVYKNFGYRLSSTSTAQARDGREVARNNLQPGDLIIFRNGSNTAIGHVGIYIGGNQFIHASSPGDVVKITSLSTSYYQARYVTARRII